METSNPSANKSGYFLTKKEAEKVKTHFEEVVKDNIDYYGKVKFTISEIGTGKEYFD